MESVPSEISGPNQCLKNNCMCASFAPANKKEEAKICGACKHLIDDHNVFQGSVASFIYRQVFGLNEVRPYHEKAVSLARDNKSLVLILPTGNGKSYCYWAPVLLSEGLAIIVEPLIALISDQLSRLNKYLKNTNFEAVAVTGEGQKSPGAYDIQDDNLFTRLQNPEQSKQIKFIYITAEKLSVWIAKKKLHKLMQVTKVNRIVFDEAYVLPEWIDFRPEHYQALSTITKSFTDLPYTLASACLTPQITTITKDLNLSPEVIIGDLSRPNLFIHVRRAIWANANKNKADAQTKDEMVYGDVIKLINKYKNDYGIIYCISRNQCDNLHKKLVEMGVEQIDKYYGVSKSGPSPRTAAENAMTMDKWDRGDVKCMIATTAFGMGIDKPNVRYVVHWTMADSAASYYQQIGRAGRDGLPSECLMYYHYYHKKVVQKVKKDKGNSDQEVRNILRYCRNNYLCRHVQISILIGQPKIEPCYKMCDICIRGNVKKLEYVDFSDYAEYLCTWIWKLNQVGIKVTVARVAEALRRNTKYELETALNDELKEDLDKLKLKLKKRYSRKQLSRHYHVDLLIEMVIRGFLRDDVSEDAWIETRLRVEKEPDTKTFYEFLVPVPIPDNDVKMPQEPLKQGLKRKREFMDSFFDEEPMAIDPDEEEKSAVKNEKGSGDEEEWEVERFVDRNADYAEPFLKVKWKGSNRHTWEPEQTVRQNCDELYHELRTRLTAEGEWHPAPKVFKPNFYGGFKELNTK